MIPDHFQQKAVGRIGQGQGGGDHIGIKFQGRDGEPAALQLIRKSDGGGRIAAQSETHIQQRDFRLCQQFLPQAGGFDIFLLRFLPRARHTVKVLTVGGVIQRVGPVIGQTRREPAVRTAVEFLCEHLQKLSFFHPPFRRDQPFLLRLGGQTHHGHGIGQDPQDFFQTFRIFIFVQYREGSGGIFSGKPGPFNDHQLVHLDSTEGQFGDLPGGLLPIGRRFPGQTQDQMCRHRDLPGVETARRLCGTGKIVSPVDPAQGSIVRCLYAQFDEQIIALVQFFQIVQALLRQTVRAGADDDHFEVRKAQRLLIDGADLLHGCIGSGKSLKISDIRTIRSVAVMNILLAPCHLFGNGHPFRQMPGAAAVGGAEGTAGVRTGKAGIQRDPLQGGPPALSKNIPEETELFHPFRTCCA